MHWNSHGGVQRFALVLMNYERSTSARSSAQDTPSTSPQPPLRYPPVSAPPLPGPLSAHNVALQWTHLAPSQVNLPVRAFPNLVSVRPLETPNSDEVRSRDSGELRATLGHVAFSSSRTSPGRTVEFVLVMYDVIGKCSCHLF